MEKKQIACIDIGGTHISVAVMDYVSKRIYEESYINSPIDSNASQDEILENWCSAIDASLAFVLGKVMAIVVSIPGPFDYENGISLMDGMHKYQSLLQFNVKSFFAQKYDIAENNIFFFNDAHAFLLGEVYHYNLESDTVVGLTLGTGLGSALYKSGEVKDLNYGSAEYLEGIAEDYISTRGILTYLDSKGTHNLSGVKELIDNQNLSADRVLAFDFLVEHLSKFIESYILPLNPKKIIIGGSIAKSHSLFLPQLKTNLSTELQIASFDELNLFFGMTSKVKL